MKLPRSVWIPILILAALVFAWRMNTQPLTNWDEGIYANVNLELFHSQDWTKLTYFGVNFLEKPPLQFWLTYPLFGIFGANEFSVRFWSVAAGIGTALLIGLWSWRASQKKIIALLAPAMFILGRFALIHAFRTGDLDGLLTFFVTLAMYGYWRASALTHNGRWMLVWGMASAAAIMTKSLAGLIPVIVVGIDVLITRGWKKIGWGNIAWGVGAFVVLVTPWHMVEAQRFGNAFWDSYLGRHVLDRTSEALFNTTSWTYYFGIIRDRFFPFSYLLPIAIISGVWRMWKRDGTLERQLLLWIITVFAIFTYIQTRREWYVLTLYPAAVMLVALSIQQWWHATWKPWVYAVATVCCIALFAYIPQDHFFLLLLQRFPGVNVLTKGIWQKNIGQLIFGVAAALFVFVISWLLRTKRFTLSKRLMLTTGGVMFLLVGLWTIQYLRSQPTTLPLKTIAARIAKENPENIQLIGTKLKKQPAGYFYILRLDTHSIEYPPQTDPRTPLVLTTNEALNAPLNTEGKVLVHAGVFDLIDMR